MNPRAVGYMVISSAAFAVMYVLAKQLSHYGGYQLTFFRGVGTFVLAAAYLLSRGVSLGGKHPRLLALRGLTGGASLLLFFIAIDFVPVTAAVAIRYLSPFFAVLIAAVWLREHVRPIQWVYLAVAFAGVLLLKGFDGRIGGTGLALILASAVLGGITFAIIRRLGTSEHPLVIVCYFTGTATLLGLVGMLVAPQGYTTPLPTDWLPLLALGVVGLVGQIFMTIAMQTENASRVMPLKYLETVFLLGLGIVYLEETYGAVAFLGMLLIVVGNVANVFSRKRYPNTSASKASSST